MSRSQPTLTNPATHFIEWSGSKGQLQWYDKERKENRVIKLPFEFLPLDELATIKGYSKRDEKSYYSNEVRSVAKEEFVVKVGGLVRQTGLYKDLADVRAKGAKYTKSIYIAHKVNDEYIIDNFNASGSALSAWIEFGQTCKPQNGKVRITGNKHVPAANGISEYYVPIFEYVHIDKEENDIAIELDKQLQIYLDQYLATPKIDDTDITADADQSVGTATPEQLADFEARKAAKLDTTPDPLDRVFNPDEYQGDSTAIPDEWN